MIEEPLMEITIPYEDGAIRKTIVDIMDSFEWYGHGDFNILSTALIPPECYWWANGMSKKAYNEWGYCIYILVDVVGSKRKFKRLPPPGAAIVKVHLDPGLGMNKARAPKIFFPKFTFKDEEGE